MSNQSQNEMETKIAAVIMPEILQGSYYDEQQVLSDEDDGESSLPPLIEINDDDSEIRIQNKLYKYFEDVSDNLTDMRCDINYFTIENRKDIVESEKRMNNVFEQLDKFNINLHKKQQKQKQKIKNLKKRHSYQKERIAELKTKIAGMVSRQKYKEQKQRVKDLETQIENVRETVHQLLGGLFNQETQTDILNQHVDRLFGITTYVENIVDTIPNPNTWDIWPTTRQGDFNENRIEKLERLINNKETDTKATSTEEEAAELLSLKELL